VPKAAQALVDVEDFADQRLSGAKTHGKALSISALSAS
jgi:hypothetical protein